MLEAPISGAPQKTWFVSRVPLSNLESVYLCKIPESETKVNHIAGIKMAYRHSHSETAGQYIPGQDQQINACGKGLYFQLNSFNKVVHIGPDLDLALPGSHEAVFLSYDQVRDVMSQAWNRF